MSKHTTLQRRNGPSLLNIYEFGDTQEAGSQSHPCFICSTAKGRFIIALAVLVTCANTLVTLPLQTLANRSLMTSKSDQAQGLPSVYKRHASSHQYRQFSRYLTMTDGTKISVEVYLPKPLKDGETIPTIYEQT